MRQRTLSLALATLSLAAISIYELNAQGSTRPNARGPASLTKPFGFSQKTVSVSYEELITKGAIRVGGTCLESTDETFLGFHIRKAETKEIVDRGLIACVDGSFTMRLSATSGFKCGTVYSASVQGNDVRSKTQIELPCTQTK